MLSKLLCAKARQAAHHQSAASSACLQVVLIGVPGAFTPTCSLKHLPGFIEKGDDLKAKGVDTIACIAVNDAFVMDAWSKSLGTDGKILMLADGSAVFAKVSSRCCSLCPACITASNALG